MASLNEVKLIGDLTRDPELKKTNGGRDVCSFSIATNRSYTDKQGKKNDEPEYHNIVAWGKLAEICGKYLVKGKQVYIGGRIKTRSWETDSGEKKYRTEIIAEDMLMLGGARGGENKPREENSTHGEGDEEINDGVRMEDIPF